MHRPRPPRPRYAGRLVALLAVIGALALLTISPATPVPPTPVHAAPTPAVLLGNTAIEASNDNNPPGLAQAFSYTPASAGGTVGSLSAYLDASNAAAQVVLGLYTDAAGAPGALLTAGTITAPVAGAWNTVAVPPVTVSAATTYWLAILGPATTGTVQFRDRSSGGLSFTSAQSTLTALPATWGTGTGWAPFAASLYASAAVAGTPPPAPTPVPTVVATATPAPTPVVAAGSRVPWQGGNWYLQGANVPWVNWGCDFGCGAGGGASSSSVQATLDPVFAQSKASGMHVIRWWVFPGDPWQITRDATGKPTGLNPAIYADFDAALALAQKYDLYFDFMLFSGPTAIPTGWITDATQRQALATTLGPLFAHYKANSRVMSWEIFNEPEFDIWGGKIAQAPVQAAVKALATAVHANSSSLVTVGGAMLDGLPMWIGQGLDFYTVHWYDFMNPGNWCARCTDYTTVKAQYGLDKPLAIGEFYAGPTTDALQRFEDWYAKGYAGAWAWSLLPSHTADGMAIDMAAAATFASHHTDLGPRTGTAPVPPTPVPPTPVPTVVATATPTPTVVATATPVPTVVATGTPLPAWTSKATVTPSTVKRGSAVSIAASVTSGKAISALVDVEVYDPNGNKVFQKFFDNQAFTAGQTRSYTMSWTTLVTATPGAYTVRIGVFSPGWGTLYNWNVSAGQLTVTR